MTDYSSLSDEELLNEYKLLSKEVAKYNNFQMAKKILMNSLYGAMAQEGFRFFDPRIAEGITMTGQYFIRHVGAAIDEYIFKITGSTSKGNATIYQDTDSVDYSTLIYVNGEKIKIGDYYNSVQNVPFITASGVEIKKPINDLSIGSYDGLHAIEGIIQYVMKHKVKKRMFTIKCNGDSVKVTEDHSVMVLRENILISAKVSEIKNGDKIVKICK